MKKQKILLGLASLAVLSSCGTTELTDSAEIADIKDAIAFRKGDFKNFEFRANYKQTKFSTENSEKKEVTSVNTAIIQANADGEFYASILENNAEIKYYLVNDKNHGKVIYIDCYEPEDDDSYLKVCSLKEDKTTFNDYFENEIARLKYMPYVFIDPYQFLDQRFSYLGLFEDATKINSQINYYSEGEGNLTIEAVDSFVQDKENVITKYSLHYEDYAFKTAEMKMSFPDSKTLGEIDFHFSLEEKKDKISITLPLGWENFLEDNTLK